MKNKIITFLILSVFLIQTSAFATDYNYLPDDVYIKQQEEKSALEYRLRKLENQSQNSPGISILDIENRITELEREKEIEKNYLKGSMAQNGSFVQSAYDILSAKIDAKFQAQIDSLVQQKALHQSQIQNTEQNKNQITELKAEIAKLRASQAEKTTPKDNYYPQEKVVILFELMDSLSTEKANNLYQNMYIRNESVALRVKALYKAKYPNGKPFVAEKVELKTQPKITSVEQKNIKVEIKTEEVITPAKIIAPIAKPTKKVIPKEETLPSTPVEKIEKLVPNEKKELPTEIKEIKIEDKKEEWVPVYKRFKDYIFNWFK